MSQKDEWAVYPRRPPDVVADKRDDSLAPADTPPLGRTRALPPSVVIGPMETTRYLCAAAHLDPDFCERVIDDVVEEPYHAIGASYGVDVAAVARHALAARRRRVIRDRLLLVALGLFVVLLVLRLRSAGVFDGTAEWSPGIVLTIAWPALLALAAAWLVTAAEIWITRTRVLPKLAAGRFNPGELQPRVNARLQDRLAALDEVETGNVVVFRGFKPFVGAGIPIDGWSFAVDVTKGKVDAAGARKEPTLFTAEQLHAHLMESLGALGLPGLRVAERLFIDGFDVARDSRLLPERLAPPRTKVSHAVLAEALREPQAAARTYLCLEAAGWHGHLVVTMFARAVRLPGSLFVEATTCVLLPLRNRYYRIDTVRPRSGVDAIVSVLGVSLRRFLRELFASPFRVAGAAGHARATRHRRRDQHWMISNHKRFDYGASTSIREQAMGTDPNRYFLLLDQEMYVKVAQERLLQSISEFLRDHDVDTAEFSVQQTVINRNRTVNFGPISGENVAVAAGNVQGLTQQSRGDGRGAGK